MTAQTLVGDREGVAARLGAQRSLVHLVVQVAGLGGAFVLAGDVAQVGAQYPVADRLAVGQLQVALLVDIFQAGMPGADHGVVAVELELAATEVEVTALNFIEGHVGKPCFTTLAVLPELAAVQGQAVDLVGSQLRALEGLRQRTTIVRTQDRQHGEPFADLQLGVGQLGLGGDGDTTEFVGRAAVVMHRQHVAVVSVAVAVEFHREHAQHVEAEADRAFGIAGARIEDEALGPGFCLGLVAARPGVVDEVAVEVVVAQAQGDLGVIDETGCVACAGQGGETGGEQCGTEGGIASFHCFCAPSLDKAVPLQADGSHAREGRNAPVGADLATDWRPTSGSPAMG